MRTDRCSGRQYGREELGRPPPIGRLPCKQTPLLDADPPPPLWTEWLTDASENITFPCGR